jgi:hypothetical protein
VNTLLWSVDRSSLLGTDPGRAGSEPQGVSRAGSTSMIRRGQAIKDRYQSITWVDYGRESNYGTMGESPRLYTKEIRVRDWSRSNRIRTSGGLVEREVQVWSEGGRLSRDRYQSITWVDYGRESNYGTMGESSRLYTKEIRGSQWCQLLTQLIAGE